MGKALFVSMFGEAFSPHVWPFFRIFERLRKPLIFALPGEPESRPDMAQSAHVHGSPYPPQDDPTHTFTKVFSGDLPESSTAP